MKEIPFRPVKPIRGGRPLDKLYCELANDSQYMCQAKIDGKRAIWDGEVLWSRMGNRIESSVTRALANFQTTLDGEYVKGTYYVYDLPDTSLPLRERWALLEWVISEIKSPNVLICPRVTGWQEVINHGWEGVVFKKLTSLYPKSYKDGVLTSDWIKYRAEWL